VSAEKQLLCPHDNFAAQADVERIEDAGRFMVALTIQCTDCGIPFSFKGLPCGMSLNGATVSPDGTEARLAMVPGRGGILTEYLEE
jgi:hypothetical protein